MEDRKKLHESLMSLYNAVCTPEDRVSSFDELLRKEIQASSLSKARTTAGSDSAYSLLADAPSDEDIDELYREIFRKVELFSGDFEYKTASKDEKDKALRGVVREWTARRFS